MMADIEVLHIIQDHESITQFLDALCCSIENEKVDVPNFVPLLNDGLIGDRLTQLAEYVRKTKAYEH